MSMYDQLHRDFALRTKRNLEFIEHAQKSGQNVSEVTQLINSLLGMIVFLNETNWIPDGTTSEVCPDINYEVLVDTQKSCKTFRNFVRRFRNAISHCRIVPFDNKSGIIQGFELCDYPNPKINTWKIRMDTENIKKFALFLVEYVIKNAPPVPESRA